MLTINEVANVERNDGGYLLTTTRKSGEQRTVILRDQVLQEATFGGGAIVAIVEDYDYPSGRSDCCVNRPG